MKQELECMQHLCEHRFAHKKGSRIEMDQQHRTDKTDLYDQHNPRADSQRQPLSRRAFLRNAATLSGALVLAACGGAPPAAEQPTSAAAPAAAPPTAAPAA